MADKPVFKPEWATDDVVLPEAGTDNKTRPIEEARRTGYDYKQKAPVQEWNWMFNNIYEWVEYFESTTDAIGITDIASQSEAEAGTINTALMTPLRTKQYSDQYGLGGSKRLASNNMNDLVKSGFYYVTNALNLPSGNTEGHVTVSGTGTSGEVLQEFSAYNEDVTNEYHKSYRMKLASGTWTPWRQEIVGEPLPLSSTGNISSNGINGHSHEIDIDSFFNNDNALDPDNQLFAGDGYQKLPGGLIIQWGTTTVGDDSRRTVTLPLELPTGGLVVMASYGGNAVAPGNGSTLLGAIFLSNTQIRLSQASVNDHGSDVVNWFVLGF